MDMNHNANIQNKSVGWIGRTADITFLKRVRKKWRGLRSGPERDAEPFDAPEARCVEAGRAAP